MTPEWLDTAVFYQVYPQSFVDSNGDGIGDLQGLIGRLDDIAALGCNVLWLNPVFDSPFLDAGYDVRDHLRVAPRYGSNDDVRRLCEEAHARGMRVCLDLVAGHTSADHPGFLQSARPEPNVWSDRFVWSDNPWLTRDGDLTLISGTSDRMGAYAVNFFAHQPALNYGFQERRRPWQQAPDAPGPAANRAWLKEVLGFWFEHGVDGFRVDLAASLVKQDPQQIAVRALWRELRAWLDATWPEKILISEWGEPARAVSGGFHVDFMLHFGTPGYPELFFEGNGFARIRSGVEHCYFDRAAAGDFRHFLRSFRLQQETISGRGCIGLPSANHDFQRPRIGARDEQDLAVIFAFLLSWQSVPFIYYGDEIGMRFLEGLPSKEGAYQRVGSRTPMQWDATPGAGFSNADPARFYLPLDPDPERPDVASQRADPDSLWHWVRILTNLRRTLPALAATAPLCVLDDSAGYSLCYLRGSLPEQVLVVLNPSGKGVTWSLPAGLRLDEVLATRGARAENGKVALDGPGAGFFRVSADGGSRER